MDDIVTTYKNDIASLLSKNKMVDKQLSIYNDEIKKQYLEEKDEEEELNLNYTSVKALSHTAPYKIHKYFARRPWNVFENLIEIFSRENDIVLDPFCGGGTTIYEGLKLNRKVVGFDLNPLSIFVVSNMVKKGEDISGLFGAFQKVISYTGELYQDYYFIQNDKKVYIDWIETTYIISCPGCHKESLLSNELRDKSGRYFCSHAECIHSIDSKNSFHQRKAKRIGHKYLYLVGKDSKNEKVVKQVDAADEDRLNKHLLKLKELLEQTSVVVNKDKIPKNWDRQKEDILEEKNIIYFQDLFTERNLLINSLLLEYIKGLEKSLAVSDYGLLRIALSNTVKETNIMSFTNDTWQGGKPTTWSKHAYWIPSQFCEVNILSALIKSLKRVIDAILYNRKIDYCLIVANKFGDLFEKANFYLENKSIAQAELPENSIDVIITDPPYGSNVQYLELSHFWYTWNKDLYKTEPDFSLEAVSNRKKGFKGAKSMYDYEENLYKVFCKSYNALKPDRYMIFTFNNKDISAWLALLFSVFRSGFTLAENGLYFQDGVDNYKQTAHTRFGGSPYGDFIYVFKKASSTNLKVYTNQKMFEEDLDNLYQKYSVIDIDNKYDWLMGFIKESVPLIEGFSKSFLINEKHTLFEKFSKSYLNKIY